MKLLTFKILIFLQIMIIFGLVPYFCLSIFGFRAIFTDQNLKSVSKLSQESPSIVDLYRFPKI